MSSTIRAKRGPKLPVVLTVEEVRQLFSHMEGKQLLIAQVLYGAGLRLMELARLRVSVKSRPFWDTRMSKRP